MGVSAAPEWLLGLLATSSASHAVPVAPERQTSSGVTPYGSAALRLECDRVRSAPEGSRNDTLNKAAFSLGQLVAGSEAGEAQVVDALRQAGLASGLPEHEVLTTIESGLRAGMQFPRRPPVKNSGPARIPHEDHDSDQLLDGNAADYILVPGQHVDDRGVLHEVGADDWSKAVLEALPHDALYRWDFVVGEIVGEPGNRRFVPLSDNPLRLVVDRYVKLAKWVKRRDGVIVRVFVACTRDHAGVLLAAAAASDRIRELHLIAHHPVYGPDFSLVQPGWNEKSRIFYDEPAELVGLQPNPDGALKVLADLVVDFPFRDEASRQNTYGMMLTPIVRTAIHGNVPFHLVGASMERTGKGKLIDSAVGQAVLGCSVETLQIGSTEEEREKRITAAIIKGATVLHLDNLPSEDVLDSPALASLATSKVWTGRVLGHSKLPALPNNLVVTMSGNNVRASGELVKRTVPIFLQPPDDHPEDRSDFVHPEIELYGQQRRRAVLEALLGMVEAWKAMGRPGSSRVMGGFEQWTSLVGGVMELAGATQWMSNYRAWVRRADDWTADARVLLKAWDEQFGAEEITSARVLTLVHRTGTFPAVTAGPPSGHLVVLARRVLIPLVDRPVGTWLVRRTTSGSSSRYRLEEALP